MALASLLRAVTDDQADEVAVIAGLIETKYKVLQEGIGKFIDNEMRMTESKTWRARTGRFVSKASAVGKVALGATLLTAVTVVVAPLAVVVVASDHVYNFVSPSANPTPTSVWQDAWRLFLGC